MICIEFARFTILMLIQIYPGTIVSIINLCANGVLGIPSVIFAKNLMEETNLSKRISGILLGLSGVFCFISVGSILLVAYSLAGTTSVIVGFCALTAEIPLLMALLKE